MKKNRVKGLLALGLSLTMMISTAGCGKEQQLNAEINPDTPVLTGPALYQISFQIKRIWHWLSLEICRMVCLMQV